MKALLRAVWATRMRRFLVVATCLLLAYTLAGFFLLPVIIRAVATNSLSKALEREVSIEKVETNPYKFTCRVRGLRIQDLDGERFFDWENVFVDFELASLFRRQWVFKELSIVRPYGRVLIKEDGELNFSDLVQKFSTESEQPEEPPKPLRLRIEKLSLTGASVSLTDRTPSRDFARLVGPLDLTVNHFETSPESENPYSFTGVTDAGERFSWTGQFAFAPLRSEGQFSLETIALNGFEPFYQDFVRFEIQDGVLDLRSGYRLEFGPSNLVAAVTNASLGLKSFKLAAKGDSHALVELSELSIEGVNADFVGRTANVRLLSAVGGSLAVRRSEDAKIDVVEVTKPAATDEPKPGFLIFVLRSVTNLFSLALQSTNAWTGTLDEVALTNFAAGFEDRANSRPVEVNVDQISFSSRNLSNLPDKEVTAALALRLNTNGLIKTELTASLHPARADIGLEAQSVQLRPLDPYLEQFVDLFILNSLLNLEGRISLRSENRDLPEVAFEGSMELVDFASVDSATSEELIKWGSLGFSGIKAKLVPPSVSATQAQLRDGFARVVYQTNGTVNLKRVFHLDRGPEETADPATTASDSDRSVNSAPAAGGPETIIDRLVVTNSQLVLVDRSIDPDVTVSVERIGGEVEGLSTRPDQRTSVKLTGYTENTGPLEVEGEFALYQPLADTAFTVRARGTDLEPADPYAGKYVGYTVDKGKLALDLKYAIKNGNLAGENLVTLDQLTLGRKTDSPDATKLPVKLAVAILKDRQGKIELDVPVEGSLEDPEFRLGGVVAQSVGNVIGKLVTSPFRALGGLFGGKGEEVSYQDFEAGRAELSDEAREKLDAVVNGLYERPGLQLEVVGSVDRDADGPELRTAALERRLLMRKWRSLAEVERSDVSPTELSLAAAEREQYLREAYAEAFPEEAASTVAGLPSAEATNVVSDASTTPEPPSVGEVASTAASGNEPGEASAPESEPVAGAEAERPAEPRTVPVTPRRTRAVVKGARLLSLGFSGARDVASEPVAAQTVPAEPLALAPEPPKATEGQAEGVEELPATPTSEPGDTSEPAESAPPIVRLSASEMERRLLEVLEISDEEFDTLASERAKVVMEYVLQSGKVDAERVFLADQATLKEKPEGSRVYLQLQ